MHVGMNRLNLKRLSAPTGPVKLSIRNLSLTRGLDGFFKYFEYIDICYTIDNHYYGLHVNRTSGILYIRPHTLIQWLNANNFGSKILNAHK